ncbi:PREDICTED: uncharacterized protein LOC106816445 [Priapulus caudatus]|uniref:Uncharacterized protein LOC106816445 n=1 Tax=Priapulus caudatus TaxID=37621 RepID=A0ABM1EWH9_PRICU|nr:PREDICTED: uncharacterized protein LOC106816445 [Priapulus caudatus]
MDTLCMDMKQLNVSQVCLSSSGGSTVCDAESATAAGCSLVSNQTAGDNNVSPTTNGCIGGAACAGRCATRGRSLGGDDANESSPKQEGVTGSACSPKQADDSGDVNGGAAIAAPDSRNSPTAARRQESMRRSRTTLGERYQSAARECSLLSCLHQFTTAELLTGNNRFGCETCSHARSKINSDSATGGKPERVYTNASKQFLIYNPPVVLTAHLKRFQQGTRAPLLRARKKAPQFARQARPALHARACSVAGVQGAVCSDRTRRDE